MEVRLIDANALLDKFLRQLTERELNKKFMFTACEIKQDFADMVCEAPTIDPESLRPKGKWMEGDELDYCGNRKPLCSVCGKFPLFNWADYAQCKYCPNCGAKMED